MTAAVRRHYVWAAPAIFLFVLPIAHTTPLRLVCLGLAIVTTLASMRDRVAAARPQKTVLAALAFWIVVCLAASFGSIEPDYSWGEFRNEVAVPMVAFGVFYFLTDRPRAWFVWCGTLLASLVVATTVAIASYARDPNWARSSFVGDRNAYSTYIVLIIPLLMLLWVKSAGHPRRRAALGAAALLALVSAALTQNRNLWFAVACEALVFAALCWWRGPAELRRRHALRLVIAGAVGMVLFAGVLAYVIHEKAAVSNTTVEEQARFDRDPRFEIWSYAIDRIRERPWTGFGYGRGILRKDFRSHFDNPLKWHGHNVVINYWIEAGPAGAIAIVGLFFALFAQAAALYRRGEEAIWPLGAWVIAMLVGIAIKTATDDILVRESSLLFWSTVGMAFGLGTRLARGSVAPGHAMEGMDAKIPSARASHGA